ncbi:MAG: hypothetical protein J6S44_01760 [Clostridia bacterium]|nr:hypothetical protein [Clostridia bacterium]MBO7170991.1 hypothetical protein [Clostridia bacterium]
MGRHNSETTHRSHPFRNLIYTVYSLLNAMAFTCFFYYLYSVERSAADNCSMIVCGAVAALGLFVGILKPLFSKKR